MIRAGACAPGSPFFWLTWVPSTYNKGYALSELTRHEEAIVCCNQALEIDPKYASAWFNKGNALWALGRAREALAPNMISINDTLGWIQYKKGNYLIAVGLLSEVVSKLLQSAEYRYHLGMALNGAGQKYRARDELQKALQLARR